MTKYEEFLRSTDLSAMDNINRAFKEQSIKRSETYFYTFLGQIYKDMDMMNPLEFELWEEKIKMFFNIEVHREGKITDYDKA